jgi:ribosome-associated heat shock protein Hsp15
VKVNGAAAKPSTSVRAGDTVTARIGERERILEVQEILDKRVAAPVAATCYTDHSLPMPPRALVPMVPRRDPSAGRPTKKERRDTDRLRGR